MTIGIDPGHNGLNGTDPAYLNRLIWNGRQWETCDTTGTETDAGYTEALFNFRVAMFLRTRLLRDGARVVLTRPTRASARASTGAHRSSTAATPAWPSTSTPTADRQPGAASLCWSRSPTGPTTT